MGKVIKKKKSVSLPALLKKTQIVVNRYIRDRDSDDGFFKCISCSRVLDTDQMNAGHYVPQHGGSFLRFHEWNLSGECQRCNCFDEFHLIGYKKNLEDKIGVDAVKWLEDNRNVVKKWSRSELEEIIQKYTI
jgi:hypothetical protein